MLKISCAARYLTLSGPMSRRAKIVLGPRGGSEGALLTCVVESGMFWRKYSLTRRDDAPFSDLSLTDAATLTAHRVNSKQGSYFVFS